jgi:hypothetical protein
LRGHELGVVLVSNNVLANDWIAAQILNLDPLKIQHLRIAMDRGWGPIATSQIELGGAGREGIQQLSQKSRFWNLNFVPVQKFGEAYTQDSGGSPFPLEILSHGLYETSGAHGILLAWLHQFSDLPERRHRIATWPPASVYVGEVNALPSNKTVYVIGRRAIDTINRITSSNTRVFRLQNGIEWRRTQLKNGKWHDLIQVPEPNLKSLTMAFTLGSQGRMTWSLFGVRPFLRWTLAGLIPGLLSSIFSGIFSGLFGWIFSKPKKPHSRPTKQSTDVSSAEVVLTARLPHNTFWSLPAFSRPEERP